MKLLILTQKVDKKDSVLGFFHLWIEEFAKNIESVIVICLEKGQVDLPQNVKVFSLGKEKRVSKIKYIFNFYKLIWKYRKEYDSVFVHMNQIYVILGGLVWKMLDKRLGLWYTHKQVSFSLRIAVILCDVVFSASDKSFRLSTKKLKIMGHGIDTNVFSPGEKIHKDFRILSVGRVSPVKNINLMIEAMTFLFDQQIYLDIAGEGTEKYTDTLKSQVRSLGLTEKVRFLGPFIPAEIPSLYQKVDLFINLSDTGSVDKVVLEAMSCGINVLTSNEAFVNILDSFYLTTKKPKDIAQHIKTLITIPADPKLREYVVKHHNLAQLIPRIINSLINKDNVK